MQKYILSQFKNDYKSDALCLEEVKNIKFPEGIYCKVCKDVATHYRLKNRIAYSCKNCRTQVYPLKGTLFEKSTTPLRIWFYAIYLMTHTQAGLSIRQLQLELGVTYKTAWRIYKGIYALMQQNNADLLKCVLDDQAKIHKWVFFNKIELKFVHK